MMKPVHMGTPDPVLRLALQKLSDADYMIQLASALSDRQVRRVGTVCLSWELADEIAVRLESIAQKLGG